MKKENYWFLIADVLALISCVVLFLFNVGAFSSLRYIGDFQSLPLAMFIFKIIYMTVALILAVINIAKLACKDAAGKVGLVTVIFAVAAEFLLVVLSIVYDALWGMFVFPTQYFIALVLCAGLLVGFIVCNKKFPDLRTDECDWAKESFLSIGLHIAFLLVFGFIWQYIWIYRTTKLLNERVAEKRNLTGTVLLCMFVPFYIFYWIYKTAKNVDEIGKSVGIQSEIATLCLVLELFFLIIPPILIQLKINDISSAMSKS